MDEFSEKKDGQSMVLINIGIVDRAIKRSHNNRLSSDHPHFTKKITMPSYAKYFKYSVNT